MSYKKVKVMSCLKKYFNKGIDQRSPVQKDYTRVVKTDGDIEVIEWKEVDYRKLQRSLGKVSDWNLDTLLKAGVNPNFPIRTGSPTRLEGLSAVSDFTAVADELLGDVPEEVPSIEENK